MIYLHMYARIASCRHCTDSHTKTEAISNQHML